MNRMTLTALAGSIALGSLLATGAYADPPTDKLVCYKVDDRDEDNTHYRSDRVEERLVLNIKFHSKLSPQKDKNQQIAYDIAGKYVAPCKDDYKLDMTTADGTLITSDKQDRPSYGRQPGDNDIDKGTRLGVHAMGALRKCNNVTFDCTSREVAVAPNKFRCKVRTEGDEDIRRVKLKKVDFKDECRVFRDREEYIE